MAASHRHGQGGSGHGSAPCFGAIDLGTNNCRLLIAIPRRDGFRVIDAYSQVVRLGAGLSRTGAIAPEAMDRTLGALRVCARKMAERNVTASRNIATEACRAAANGATFLDRVRQETGLQFTVISPEAEAKLSVRGCHDLIDPEAEAVMVFDIGGGSTEISWLLVSQGAGRPRQLQTVAWTSLPLGVVTLAEHHGEPEVDAAAFEAMAARVATALAAVPVPAAISTAFAEGRAHLIGTSGTVTSLAGVHLGLAQYSRRAVDGIWLSAADAAAVSTRLREVNHDARAGEPCIGIERADLVVPGCAILDGIMRVWPCPRIRVGDRGLREGVLFELIEDWRAGRV